MQSGPEMQSGYYHIQGLRENKYDFTFDATCDEKPLEF